MPQVKPMTWIPILLLLNFLMILVFNSFPKNNMYKNFTSTLNSPIYEKKTKW